MADQLDVPLEDAVLLQEVELVSALMIAASDNEGHLDQTAIDKLLGVSQPGIPSQGEPEAG